MEVAGKCRHRDPRCPTAYRSSYLKLTIILNIWSIYIGQTGVLTTYLRPTARLSHAYLLLLSQASRYNLATPRLFILATPPPL
jgi:hypothetical protein